MTNQEKYAWAAGFFEGEGYIGAAKCRGGQYVRIVIGQVDREVLDRFHRIFGVGRVLGPYVKTNHPEWRRIFRYEVYKYSEVKDVAKKMWPFLGKVKREQVSRSIRAAMQHKIHIGKRNEC
jgi:hypothetical protein